MTVSGIHRVAMPRRKVMEGRHMIWRCRSGTRLRERGFHRLSLANEGV